MGFIFPGRPLHGGFKRPRPDGIVWHRNSRKKPAPRNTHAPVALRHEEPDLETEQKSSLSILERLPRELLYDVFCYSGINSLPLTNKYFHAVFAAPDVNLIWWLEMIVRSMFLKKLNQFKVKKWRKKIQAKYEKLPASIRSQWDPPFFNVVDTLQELCVDSSLFQLRFMTDDLVLIIKERFQCMVLSTSDITREQELREKYLEWHYAVLLKMVLLVEEDSTFEQLRMKALNSEAALTAQKKIGDYEPITTNANIPMVLCVNMNARKLGVVSQLHEEFSMLPQDYPLLILSVVKADLPLTTVSHFVPPDVTLTIVLDLLQVLATSRKRLLQLPLDERVLHSSVVDNVLEIVETALRRYYSQNEDSGLIWGLLLEIEMPELVELVMSLGATPDIEYG